MSLTDDWQAGKLDAGQYYVAYKDGRTGKANLIETPDYYGFYNNCDLNNLVAEVLAPIPSYEEFQSLKNRLEEALQDAAYFEFEVHRLTIENNELCE